jgi:Tol biopolymer transport system component
MSKRTPGSLTLVFLLAGAAAAQTTTEVSVNSSGIPSSGGPNLSSMHLDLSPDGRVAAFTVISVFHGNTDALEDLYVHDRVSGTTTLVSADPTGLEANNRPQSPSLSYDGRFVAFNSAATNLVPADTTNDQDIFVRDVQAGTTELVSIDMTIFNSYGRNPTISHDGRFVAYNGGPIDLGGGTYAHGAVVYDRVTQTAVLANYDSNGNIPGGGPWPHNFRPLISGDGNYVAFHTAAPLVPADTNGVSDVYVRNLAAQTTHLVSLGPGGVLGDGHSYVCTIPGGGISVDGRYVAFWSDATNLVAGDGNATTDVFVRDRTLGTTTRVSVDSNGVEGNGVSHNPRLSDDGRVIAFESLASNLVAVDTNLNWDVFVHELAGGTTTMVNVTNNTGAQPSTGLKTAVSSDGCSIAFSSPGQAMSGEPMTPGPPFSGSPDVYVRDLKAGPCLLETYCTAKTNSQFLKPTIGATGAPTLAGPTDSFKVWVYGVVPGKPGLVFWGLSPAGNPFGGGTMCIGGSKHRRPVQNATALYTHSQPFDQAYMASRGWTAGMDVYAQYWGRDTPGNISLSDALHFTVCP